MTGSEILHTILATLAGLLFYIVLPGIAVGLCVVLLYAVLRGMRWLWEHSH